MGLNLMKLSLKKVLSERSLKLNTLTVQEL